MEVISAHLNADFDAFGSMLAASKLYPEATLVFAGGQGRGLQEFCRKNPGLAERFKNPGDINLDEITRLILVDVRRKSRIGPFAQVAERSGVDIHIFDHLVRRHVIVYLFTLAIRHLFITVFCWV